MSSMSMAVASSRKIETAPFTSTITQSKSEASTAPLTNAQVSQLIGIYKKAVFSLTNREALVDGIIEIARKCHDGRLPLPHALSEFLVNELRVVQSRDLTWWQKALQFCGFQVLDSGDQYRREVAFRFLEHFGASGAKAAAQALNDVREEVRIQALQSIERMGYAANCIEREVSAISPSSRVEREVYNSALNAIRGHGPRGIWLIASHEGFFGAETGLRLAAFRSWQ